PEPHPPCRPQRTTRARTPRRPHLTADRRPATQLPRSCTPDPSKPRTPHTAAARRAEPSAPFLISPPQPEGEIRSGADGKTLKTSSLRPERGKPQGNPSPQPQGSPDVSP